MYGLAILINSYQSAPDCNDWMLQITNWAEMDSTKWWLRFAILKISNC